MLDESDDARLAAPKAADQTDRLFRLATKTIGDSPSQVNPPKGILLRRGHRLISANPGFQPSAILEQIPFRLRSLRENPAILTLKSCQK
jgi:hypothetical protein